MQAQNENTENVALAEFFTLIGVQKMPKFLGVRGYENQQGDVSNYVILTNAIYGNAVAADIATLTALVATFTPESDATMVLAAQALLAAFIKPNENRSKGQTEAYTKLNGTVKKHNTTGVYYVYGYMVQKKRLSLGVQKPDTRSPLTKAKDAIRKTLKTGRYSQFPISYGDSFNVSGHRVTVTPAVKVPATV